MSGAGALRRLFPAMAAPVFARYISGASACFVAIWIQRTAIGWLAWQITGSVGWLGIVSLGYLFPLVIVGPFGGAFADRVDNVRTIEACQVIMAAAALLLTVLSGTGTIGIWAILAISIVQGATEAFSQPAQLALVPSMVERTLLTQAIAMSSVTFNTSRFIGPAIAGAVIAVAGPTAAFAVATLGFVAFLVVLATLRSRLRRVLREPREGVLRALLGGIGYTARHPGIAPLMLLVVALGGLGRSVVELFPAFAEVIFQSDARGLAALVSSVGFGAVLAGLRWSGLRQGTDLVRAMLLTSIGVVGALLAFLLAPNLYVACLVLIVLGFCTASTGITVQTLINLVVDEGYRGRVLSLFGVCFRGSPAVGALATGFAADQVGLRGPFFAAAGLLLVSWMVLRRRLVGVGQHLPGGGDGDAGQGRVSATSGPAGRHRS